MNEIIREVVKNWIDDSPEDDVNDVISELHNSEDNKEDNKLIFTTEEIKAIVVEELRKLKADPDRCSDCGQLLSDDDYIAEYESRGECWGAPCSERIVTGYRCSNCGHKENF